MELMRQQAYVAGQWIEADGWIEVDDPATGAIIGRVPSLSAAHVEQAVAASAAAMPAWAARTAKDRAAVLRRYFDLVMAHQEPLARLLTAEQGKPLAEARGEIAYAASFLEWFGEEAKRAYGELIPGHMADKRLLVMRQPIGVVGAITPWNFPAAMVTRKIAPALAAGCGIVLKPAEQTPFTALALAALAEEAGVPPGLLNVVTGDGPTIGGVLTQSPVVRKLTFTGSTEVGVLLFGQSARTMKKLSLELGGNAPLIVFDDADMDVAIAGAMQSKFRNAGQTCVCANRIYVQSGVYDTFVARLAQAAGELVVGPGTDDASQIGPLIDAAAVDKVRSHIADALEKGAAIVGDAADPISDRFVRPIVMRDVKAGMRVLVEETFGPLAPVMRFDTEAEAIGLANASEFGLASYIFTNDLGRAWRVSEAIEAGMVGVNTGLISTELAPFGGTKMSGLGREGSRHGLEDYHMIKYVCMDIGARR